MSERKRILVLDDHRDILEMIEYALDYENYEVSCVDNVPAFYTHLKNQRPHLIILDYRLNDGNGGDICNLLKADSDTCDIPVILLSAYFSKDSDLAHLSCDQFITKPFDLDILLQKVKQNLDKQKD